MPDRHQLAALAALTALRQARTWLMTAPQAEAQPGLRRTVTTRDLTTRAAGKLDGLLRTERLERLTVAAPAAPQPIPVRAALLDAQVLAHVAIMDAAWIVSSALRRHPLLVYGQAWQVVYRDTWTAAYVHLRIAIPHTTNPVAEEVHGILDHADRTIRLTIGAGPAWTPLPTRACPTCNRRTLEAEVSDMDERNWTLRCRNSCIMETVEDHGRAHGRLSDLLALIRSVRRHSEKLAKGAA